MQHERSQEEIEREAIEQAYATLTPEQVRARIFFLFAGIIILCLCSYFSIKNVFFNLLLLVVIALPFIYVYRQLKAKEIAEQEELRKKRELKDV